MQFETIKNQDKNTRTNNSINKQQDLIRIMIDCILLDKNTISNQKCKAMTAKDKN